MAKKHYSHLDDDIDLEFRFYFENLTTNDVFQTNNEALAWQKFHACGCPCELMDEDGCVAEKYFADPEYGDMRLITELHTESDEYVDLEEVEI